MGAKWYRTATATDRRAHVSIIPSYDKRGMVRKSGEGIGRWIGDASFESKLGMST